MKFAAHSVILCCVVVYGGINVTGGGGKEIVENKPFKSMNSV